MNELDSSWKDAPDWCDDCNANPGEKCPDCGYTHNCQLTKIIQYYIDPNQCENSAGETNWSVPDINAIIDK